MEKTNEVFIVAGGPSLANFDFNLLTNKDTIVVNKSILDVPNPTFFITVDFTFLRKLGVINLRMNDATKVFIVSMHFDYIQENEGRIVDVRSNLVYDLSDFDMIIKSRKEKGIGYQFKDFRNGLNSGYCALQLAVILGYKKIYLLGVDLRHATDPTSGNVESHYHGGYGEKFNTFKQKLECYYTYFAEGLLDIQTNSDVDVVSLSPISKLNNIIKFVNYKEII